ncbi:MAG: O-antigen ligase family protein, partial [Planctomycetota bacterium]
MAPRDRPAAASSFAPRLLAVGAALVLLADVPGLFTRGDVLRGALFPFLAAVALGLAASAPGRRGPGGRGTLFALLPLGIPLAALPALASPSLAGVLRPACTWIGLAALTLGLLRAWRSAEDGRWACRAIGLAGALAALWVVVDVVRGGVPGVGPFGRPGVAGPVLGSLLPVVIFVPPFRRRWPDVAAALLTGLAIVLTGSRAGMVAALLATLGAGALAARPAAARWYVRGLAVSAAAAVIVFALAATDRIRLPGGNDTIQVRLGLYRATSQLVAERPLVGHGLGSFPAEVLRRRDMREAAISRGRRPLVAHNDVMHAAAEGGVGAGLVLVLFLAGTLVLGLSAWRRREHGDGRRLAAAAVGSFACLAIASLGEDVLLDPAAALLAAQGTATILVLLAPRDRDAPRPVRWGWPALALLALGAGGVKGRDALADHQMRRYLERVAGGVDPVEALQAASEHLTGGALVWREDHPEALYRLGVHRAEFGEFGAAREAFREALRLDAGMTEAWLDISKTYEMDAQ